MWGDTRQLRNDLKYLIHRTDNKSSARVNDKLGFHTLHGTIGDPETVVRVHINIVDFVFHLGVVDTPKVQGRTGARLQRKLENRLSHGLLVHKSHKDRVILLRKGLNRREAQTSNTNAFAVIGKFGPRETNSHILGFQTTKDHIVRVDGTNGASVIGIRSLKLVGRLFGGG